MKISKLLVAGVLVIAISAANLAVAESPTDCEGEGISLHLTRTPNTAHVGGTITYTIYADVETFPPACDIDDVTLSWIPPNGVPETLIAVPGVDLSTGASTAVFTRPYVVNAGDLVYDSGLDQYTVIASAIAEGIVLDGPPNSDTDDFDEISVLIVSTPDTTVGISADPDVGVAPYPTTLTITEQNTGDDPITDVSVELRDITGTPTLIHTLTAAPTSGDFAPLGVLDIGETWTWIYGPVSVTGPTVFEVLGYGTGPLGEDVSFGGGYEFERATTGVDAITPAIEIVKTGPAYSKSEGPWGDGDTIQYHAQITNIGTEDLVIVSIDDDVFGNLGILNDYALGFGETVGLSYGYMPLPTDPDTLVNVITVVASYDVEGVTGTVTDNDDHSVDLVHPDFTVEKICLTDPIPEGEDAEFQITITNTGDATLIITTDEAAISGSILLNVDGDIVETVTIPLEEGESSVYNEITVTATLDPMYDLPNVIVRSDSAECTTQGDTFCSFTQGFYGNKGGKACGGMTTTKIIEAALLSGPVVVGVHDPIEPGDEPGPSITLNSAACIIARLPAGGTPMALPANLGNVTDDCSSPGDLPLKKANKDKGKSKDQTYNNVLIGQVVALTLNVRLADIPCLDPPDSDSPLGSYVFPGDPAVEEDVYICVLGKDGCIERYMVPVALKGLSADDVLMAANMALAGAEGLDAGALNDAASFINELFDECRTIVTCPIDPTEICDDGCDNDFDGDTDCADTDCVADPACITPG